MVVCLLRPSLNIPIERFMFSMLQCFQSVMSRWVPTLHLLFHTVQNLFFFQIKCESKLSSFFLWINLKSFLQCESEFWLVIYERHIKHNVSRHFKENKLYSPPYSKQLYNIPNKISMCVLYITLLPSILTEYLLCIIFNILSTPKAIDFH